MAKLRLMALGILSAMTLAAADLNGIDTLKAPSAALATEMDSANSDGDRARQSQLAPTAKLCPQTTGRVVTDEFHRLRDRLGNHIRDRQELSQIDAAVVQAHHDCTGDLDTVAGLMEDVALNWQEQGNLTRADELYQAAYAIERDTNDIYGRYSLLEHWAGLKLAAGEPQRAAELAKLLTMQARQQYEGQSIAKELSGVDLIHALKFQARVLEFAGLADEARAAKQEADELTAQQPPCIDLCGLTIRRIK